MTQPLSILHLHTAFDPDDPDGWNARTMQLIAALGDRARHTVVSADGATAPAPGVEHPQVPPPLAGSPSVARYEAIARFMRGFDLVLTHDRGAIDGAMARRAFPRGMPPVIHHEDPPPGDEATGTRLYRRLALSAAHSLVVTGPAAAQAARSTWKQPRDRVRVIATGVDTAACAGPADPALVKGFRRGARDVVIGVVSPLDAAADLPTLVRAVGGLSGRLRLVIVGEGAERAAIERAALAMGIDDRLVMAGARATPWRLVGGFDLLALPTRAMRTPTIALAAMAAGLPVVGLRAALADVVATENLPYLAEHTGEVRWRDAMQPLVADAALRAAVGGANARMAAAHHDAAAFVTRSAALYGAAAGRPGWPD